MKVWVVTDFGESTSGGWCNLLGIYDNLDKAIARAKGEWEFYDYEHDQRRDCHAINECELNKDYEIELG